IANIPVEQNIQLHQVALPVILELIVKGGIAPAAAFHLVEEVKDNLVQGNIVVQLDPAAFVLHVNESPPLVLTKVHQRAHIFLRREQLRVDIGFLHLGNFSNGRQVGGVIDVQHGA